MATPMNTNFSQYTDTPFDVPEETFDDDEMIYGKDIHIISGSEDFISDEENINLADIIQHVNNNNMSFVEEDKKKHLEEEQRKKEEDKRIHEQRLSEIHKDISEEEQIGREQKEKEEAEALLLEQEQQKQSSLFSKLGNIGKKKENSEKQKIQKQEKPKKLEKNQKETSEEKIILTEQTEINAANKVPVKTEEKTDIKTTPEPQETVESPVHEQKEVENSVVVEEKTEVISEPVKEKKELVKKEKKSLFPKFIKEATPQKEESSASKKVSSPSDTSTFQSEEEEWKYLATHDGLTKLKNLKAYEFDTKEMEAKNIAIIFLDVNNLKYVNDNFGHETGNKLLLATSTSINKVFPDIGYRIGGDEFLVIYQKPKAKEDKIREDIDNKIKAFQKELKNISKEDEEGLPYAVSVGYDIGNNKKSIDDIKNEADKRMYEAKKQYKKDHPDFDIRHEFKKEKKAPEPPKEYDTLLSKEQQDLKGVVKQNHKQALEETTEKIMLEIQRRNQEILAVMIASPTFDHLFIIQDVGTLIGLVNEMDGLIDYSYLYVVYEGGPQYYGTDEYYNEVTHIFEAISNGLKSGRMLTNKDIQKIKGINIFKEIYIE